MDFNHSIPDIESETEVSGNETGRGVIFKFHIKPLNICYLISPFRLEKLDLDLSLIHI